MRMGRFPAWHPCRGRARAVWQVDAGISVFRLESMVFAECSRVLRGVFTDAEWSTWRIVVNSRRIRSSDWRMGLGSRKGRGKGRGNK